MGSDASPRVQAATVRVRRAWVQENHGEAGVTRLLASCSSPLRQLLSQEDVAPGTWVDFELFVESTVLVDKLFGSGDLELGRAIGRFAAGHAQGVWKTFFIKHLPPTIVMRLASGMWHHHYDAGRLTTRTAGSTGLLLTISDWPRPHRAHCLSIAGWMHGTLELGPRTDIVVQELSCRAQKAATCDFRLSWRS